MTWMTYRGGGRGNRRVISSGVNRRKQWVVIKATAGISRAKRGRRIDNPVERAGMVVSW